VLFEASDAMDMHTVSFWPGGEDARPPVARRDEGPDRFAINEHAWERSDCGGPGQDSCHLEGSDERLSSGLPIGDPTWRVTFDLPAGTTVTYFCTVHPGMSGSIDVVDDAAALPTQEQIDAAVREQIAADTQEAIDHRAWRESEQFRRPEDGRSVWTVRVGDTTPSGHVSILGYMPSHLDEARPGDAVEFESSGRGHHSVTFPTELVSDKAIGPSSRLASVVIHPACDLDDPASGLPGIGGPWAPFSPLECPGSFELVFSPWLASPHPAPDDEVATAATYHDSGMMWSEDAPEAARGRPAGSGDYFPHSFVAEFPVAGPFGYACTLHGAEVMAGTIVVG
jgi:plastocyanin